MLFFCLSFFFFKQKTAYEMRISDWSSDVCSSDLIKFGFPIGTAKAAIARGAHVHSHNMATALSAEGGHAYRPAADPATPLADPPSFMGYLRADGRAATRNEIWVLPTVGCVARPAAKIAEAADRDRKSKRLNARH